jgi:glyoxylase-like metal-dependent hydrolase (beta-lactamase superfamily II)
MTSQTLEYPFAQAPHPGSLCQIVPGVFWLRMPLPFVLNHINLWLLEDGAGWTVVDCGFATEEARECWLNIIDKFLGGKPITRVIVTHFHPDHIGLCHWLCEPQGLIPWMTKAEFLQAHVVHHRIGGTQGPKLAQLMQAHGLGLEGQGWIERRENIYEKGVPQLPSSHRVIRHGERIRIGPHDWEVSVGFGHSPEHASLVCESLGLCIAGDMLLPRISTNVSVWPSEPEADPVGEFLASLSQFDALPDSTLVLPSHGLPFRGAALRVKALQEHHHVRLDRLRLFCQEPKTAAEVLPVLFERKFDDHHLLFAMGEAIAHLNYLMLRSQLRRLRDVEGCFRFQRV